MLPGCQGSSILPGCQGTVAFTACVTLFSRLPGAVGNLCFYTAAWMKVSSCPASSKLALAFS
jgi:hypothetical protein